MVCEGEGVHEGLSYDRKAAIQVRCLFKVTKHKVRVLQNIHPETQWQAGREESTVVIAGLQCSASAQLLDRRRYSLFYCVIPNVLSNMKS